MADAARTPADQCEAIVRSIAAKANSNKRRARLSTLILTAIPALIPVCIIISTQVNDFWVGKVVPSVLAAASALLAALVDIERPHERWNLYRRYQRVLEAELLRYRHRVGRYSGDDADKVLIEEFSRQQVDLHNEWSGLIPQSSEVASLGRASAAK